MGRVNLPCHSKAESGRNAHCTQGLLDCKMCPNSIPWLHDVCLMHPGNPGEKVFIWYINRTSLRIVPIRFAPVRAIVGMEVGCSASCCLVAFETKNRKRNWGNRNKRSLIPARNGLLVLTLCPECSLPEIWCSSCMLGAQYTASLILQGSEWSSEIFALFYASRKMSFCWKLQVQTAEWRLGVLPSARDRERSWKLVAESIMLHQSWLSAVTWRLEKVFLFRITLLVCAQSLTLFSMNVHGRIDSPTS